MNLHVRANTRVLGCASASAQALCMCVCGLRKCARANTNDVVLSFCVFARLILPLYMGAFVGVRA